MFPIIPNHMSSGSAAASIGKVSLNTAANYTRSIWNIWTEDLLRNKRCSPASDAASGEYSSEGAAPAGRDHRRANIKAAETGPANGSYVIEAIPKDTKSRSFSYIDVTKPELEQRQQKLLVGVDTAGYLVNDRRLSESVWLRSLSLAHDTYSHNAQLEITSDHRLRLRIVKNLVIDEEVQLWFSDDILAILSIPFLTPVNILAKLPGKNCYKCIDCGKTYENPNPLKLHLATNCDQYKLDDLWMRLNHAIAMKSYVQPQPIDLFRPATQLLFESTAKRLPALMPERLRDFGAAGLAGADSPFRLANAIDNSHLRHYNPYHMQHLQQLSALPPLPLSLAAPHMPAIATSTPQSFMHRQAQSTTSTAPTEGPASGEKVVAAAAAQLETIVSNMGTSKQGHVCIYCGKLYSRKYGLKIHIRTHTGFKPLKCKYCLRPFGDPSNLNKHIRLHVQEKSLYKCHLCSKILVRRRDLLRHMNIKHNISEASVGSTTGPSNGLFNDAHSSRSNSVSSDVPCDLSSTDEMTGDNNGSNSDDDDERIDVE